MKVTYFSTVVHDTDNLIVRDIPVSSTVIEFGDSNLAIIDTGISDNPNLMEKLINYGYYPSDFNLVLNTHLHPDHIGGNRLFPNARILISRRELIFERNFSRILRESEDPLAVLRSMGRVVDHTTAQLAGDLKQLAQNYPTDNWVGDSEQIEFYEDEPELPKGISTMQVPGHTIDSRAVLLQGKTRRVIVAGDTLYHRDLWRGDSMKGFHFNNNLFRQSVGKIAQLPDIIVPGHDRALDNLSQQYLKNDYFMI